MVTIYSGKTRKREDHEESLCHWASRAVKIAFVQHCNLTGAVIRCRIRWAANGHPVERDERSCSYPVDAWPRWKWDVRDAIDRRGSKVRMSAGVHSFVMWSLIQVASARHVPNIRRERVILSSLEIRSCSFAWRALRSRWVLPSVSVIGKERVVAQISWSADRRQLHRCSLCRSAVRACWDRDR